MSLCRGGHATPYFSPHEEDEHEDVHPDEGERGVRAGGHAMQISKIPLKVHGQDVWDELEPQEARQNEDQPQPDRSTHTAEHTDRTAACLPDVFR